MSASLGTAAEPILRSMAGRKMSSPVTDRASPMGRPLRLPAVARSRLIERLRISCSGVGSGSRGLTYKDAGVDIDAGSELVRRIAKLAPGIGGFGGLFPLGWFAYSVLACRPIHVAMSVNDIVTSGAKPLFFLDYFATSNLDVDLAEKVIKGIVDGCQQSDCVLLGGETAEMPDFYARGEYDLSGFAVGIVKRDEVINGKDIEAGDVLIGLPSSGVHSNGFSLVRRILAQSGLSLNDQLPNNNGKPIRLGRALMAPTIIYVKQVLDIISKGGVKGIAHITGGGFTDNIPRVFPSGLGAKIFTDSWEIPAVFKWLKEVPTSVSFAGGSLFILIISTLFVDNNIKVDKGDLVQAGGVEDAEMRRTFNMGIGMVLVVRSDAAARILSECQGSSGAYRIGEVIVGEGVEYMLQER
ncbi:hypothetical protein C4D60_Mb11t22810 [Musa balbisiana]|uniref:phosphoribosylformylglycinamidine cyclo-ligase n=1 Tax=Musa balbisiana TaxID=52838 RepID=A0A4S8J725_MUSBA|nr:hypothetical protein C4D60_Mb11t22810 [Musa balbisiana]